MHRNALVYRRVWRGSVFSSFVQPGLFFLAMGFGLGAFIDTADAALPHGASFLEFLAPGLLAAACMQTASFESSWPVVAKMRWHRNYHAMTATPLGAADIVLGELVWTGVRLAMVAVAFTLVMLGFGVVRSAGRLPLVVAAGVLTGLAFAAPILAYAATLKTGTNFNVLYRFGITPLFLFSGVFFPVTRLPEGLELVTWATPLFHGVELVRGLTRDTFDSPIWLVHVGYLAAMACGGVLAALRTFRRSLYP